MEKVPSIFVFILSLEKVKGTNIMKKSGNRYVISNSSNSRFQSISISPYFLSKFSLHFQFFQITDSPMKFRL